MKKLLALMPLLAGGAWAGTTYVAGNQTEPAYNDLIARINQQSPVRFVVESFDKGYLTSTAITQVMQSSDKNAEVAVRLKHDISHSTVAMGDAGARLGKSSIKTTLLFDEALDPELQKFLDGFNGLAPIELISTIGISGEADNHLLLNPISFEENNLSVVSGGGVVRFSIDKNQAINGSGELKPFSVTDVSENRDVIAAQASQLAFDIKLNSSGLYHGSQSYSVEKLSGYSKQAGQTIELTNIKLDADSDLAGQIGSANLRFSVGDIDSMLPVNSGALEATVDGMSVQAIAAFRTLTARLEQLAPNDTEALEVFMSDYAKMVTELFQAGSSLGFTVKLNNDGGSAQTVLGLNRNVDAANFTSAMTLGDLLKSVAGELSFDADGAAIDLTPLAFMLQAPPASDFIAFDGSNYNSKVVLDENVITLNGDMLPLDMMLGPYLDMPVADAMRLLE